MWNAHAIRGPKCDKGHGGGVPQDMFYKDPIGSTMVVDADAEFEVSRGELQQDSEGRLSVDTGTYGADLTNNTLFEARELQCELLATQDPLLPFPTLLKVREIFLAENSIEYSDPITSTTPVKDVTDFTRHSKYVQNYLHFKEVNTELLQCALSCWMPVPGDQYDWDKFVGQTQPGSHACLLRSLLRKAAVTV
jgi:hypothetical protein